MLADSATPLVRLVEDDDDVRASMVRCLARRQLPVQAFRSAGALLGGLDFNSAGCLVIDLNLPDMSGHELLAELGARQVRLPVLFISGNATIADAAKAMRMGAIDFLEKPFSGDQLCSRVLDALSLDERNRGRHRQVKEIERRIATLSPRERQVMEMVCDGMPTKVIARRLDISPKTVEVYRSKVTRGMQIQSVPQLVRLVTEYRLATDAPAQEGNDAEVSSDQEPIGNHN